MTARSLFITIAIPLLVVVTQSKRVAATEAKTADGRVPSPGAVGMCEEHGVLEAICTKCNPALIPVFKAKGDWCEEHGFPESICPLCHPERGGKPSRDVSADGAPGDGTKVRFKTKETARLAGLQFAPVAEQPSSVEVVATAKVVYDATRVAEVNARAPGVVRAIRADVGARVEADAPLAVIESAAVGAEQSRLRAAASRVKVAEASYKRERGLHEEGVAAEREVQAARQDLDAARAELAATEAALGVVETGTDGASRYTLTTPLAGVVTKRRVTIGRVVDTEEVLFEIVDTSTMWAEIDILEADLPNVAVGQPVSITIDGLGDRELRGTLNYIAAEIDPHTRTATGRVALDNPAGILRANMFGQARIAVTGAGQTIVVPREAVQRARSAHLVFVRLAEDLYEARRVQVISASGDSVAIRGRLQPGEAVVTAGSFLLKTETLKESIGAGCCDVD